MKAIVFYIADQEQYVREAVISANSLKIHMPEIKTILYSPNYKILYTSGFDYCVKLPPRESEFFYFDHARFMNIAVHDLFDAGLFDYAIFMDCDTFVCAPFGEVFDLINHGFDFMGAHAPGRQTTRTTLNLSPAFPEINLGFNPYPNKRRVIEFFDDFYNTYKKNLDVYRNNDQGALRDTLWDYYSSLNYYILPPEYNCRFNFPCFVSGEVKILHGHSSDIADVALRVNSNKEMRSWQSGAMSG